MSTLQYGPFSCLNCQVGRIHWKQKRQKTHLCRTWLEICCIFNYYVTVSFSKELLAPMNQNLEEIKDMLKALLSSKENSSKVFIHTSQTLVYLFILQSQSCNSEKDVKPMDHFVTVRYNLYKSTPHLFHFNRHRMMG